MSTGLLSVLVLAPSAAVVVAIVAILWRARPSARHTRVVVASGVVLALWLAITSLLAWNGTYLPPGPDRPPPLGIALVLALVGLAAALSLSGSLREVLTDQRNLLRLNVWRLVGIVFLLLMAAKQAPPLWALPAGIGDILIGATAFWVAAGLDGAAGARRAILFNVLGLADLVVAVGLGIMTSPGPGQVFETQPTAEVMTHFPMALVPTFLVPLAVAVHVVSLRQLVAGTWAPPATAELQRHAAARLGRSATR